MARTSLPKYEVIIYWSDEDKAFIAEIPELPGCAADGQTYQEALTNVERVIQEWIEPARELGRTVPEPRGAWCLLKVRLNTEIKPSAPMVLQGFPLVGE